MSCLVDSDGTTFRFRGDFRLLFQTTNNTVYGIEEILFAYELLPWRAAISAASLQTLAISAPEKPGVWRANRSTSTVLSI